MQTFLSKEASHCRCPPHGKNQFTAHAQILLSSPSTHSLPHSGHHLALINLSTIVLLLLKQTFYQMKNGNFELISTPITTSLIHLR